MICDVLSSFLLFDVGLQGAFGAFSRFCSRKPTAISCRLFAIVWTIFDTFDKMEVMVHDGSNCKIKVNTSRDVRDVDWLCFHRLMFSRHPFSMFHPTVPLCHWTVTVFGPGMAAATKSCWVILLPCRAPCRVQKDAPRWCPMLGDPCFFRPIDRMTGWMSLKSLKALPDVCVSIQLKDDCERALFNDILTLAIKTVPWFFMDQTMAMHWIWSIL